MADKAKIKELIEQHLSGTDQFLVDIKLSPNRLLIAIDKPSGILLDECSALGRFLAAELEEDGMLETHEMEVGSPGMDSSLLVPQQYFRRIGRELKVMTTEGREIKGILLKADNEGIELQETVSRKENKKKIITEVLHSLPYNMIKDAKIVLNFKLK